MRLDWRHLAAALPPVVFAALSAAQPAGGGTASPPKPEMALPAAGAPVSETAALRNEVADLRDDIRLLQQTLDVLVNQMMADLRAQNELLRDEVGRLRAQREALGLPEPAFVPRPGAEELEALLLEEPAPPPPAPFALTVVREWGRDPETAAEMGEGAATLKGLIGAVPPGSSREDVETLGRELRAEYAGYDNINIEVFDDPEAARAFADEEKGGSARRVLSVSRHRASGRDTILYIQNGKAEPVAFEGADPPPPDNMGGAEILEAEDVPNAEETPESSETPPEEDPLPTAATEQAKDAEKAGPEDDSESAPNPKSVMGRKKR